MVLGSPDLMSVALLQMFLDVGIYSGPVVELDNRFSGFGDPVVSGEHGPVGIGKDLGDDLPREIKYGLNRAVLPLDSFPDQSVIHEAVLRCSFDLVSKRRVSRKLLTDQVFSGHLE